MWQLEMEAIKASSGSMCAGLDQGTGTTCGEDDAGTVMPPSKDQVCSREYLPRRKSGFVRRHLMIALYSAIKIPVRLMPIAHHPSKIKFIGRSIHSFALAACS